jgi:outer membrane receptor for ferrienterochelin and colicins
VASFPPRFDSSQKQTHQRKHTRCHRAGIITGTRLWESHRDERTAAIFARRLLVSFVLLPLGASVGVAQTATTGTVTGTVTVPFGGRLPGADILAKNAQTGIAFSAVANDAGVWILRAVPPGRYTVSVALQGYRSVDLSDVKVEAGSTTSANATLQIGLQADVVVTASRYEQDVINAPATASVIPGQAIQDGTTRQMADLLRAVPGTNVVQMSGRQVDVSGRGATGVQLMLVDGRTVYVDYLGITHWDGVQGNIDEIKQVEVIRGPASGFSDEPTGTSACRHHSATDQSRQAASESGRPVFRPAFLPAR